MNKHYRSCRRILSGAEDQTPELTMSWATAEGGKEQERRKMRVKATESHQIGYSAASE